eukprot:TRINITY_DN135216_c0_g1_i1.p5 TRINITY_DN135216_c0_g1~~TRINITY_DN135216_c0_g1_i1.p5  ORF type:complete len:130 (-),score=6.55 TRINITY_DN135216_c0_g1_i1:331-720(-)
MYGATGKDFFFAIASQFMGYTEGAIEHKNGGDYKDIHDTGNVVLVNQEEHYEVTVRESPIKSSKQSLKVNSEVLRNRCLCGPRTTGQKFCSGRTRIDKTRRINSVKGEESRKIPRKRGRNSKNCQSKQK